MGNRAVITWSQKKDVKKTQDLGIYLHWNGGRDSVEAFLTYCKLQGFREPDHDNYGYARLCQVIGNFFGGDLSLGIDKCRNLDCNNGDNGTYICKGWDIVGRQYFGGREQQVHDLIEMLNAINKSMPEEDRLSQEVIDSCRKK
jgi:hypothetical protein